MKRFALLLPVVVAVVTGLLVASPADAAGGRAALKSKNIAISTAGDGKVAISCSSASTCRGRLRFLGSTKITSYSVPAHSTTYEPVSLKDGDAANPHHDGVDRNGQYRYHAGVTLRVSETSPRAVSHDHTVTTETLLRSQQITGTVAGVGGSRVSDLRVELVTVVRGGNTRVKKFDDELSGGDFSFSIPLGPNNSPSATYRLRISAKDQDGIARSWFWRGSDGAPAGGGRYLREASAFHAEKYEDFDADFRYSSIGGSAPTGTSVTIAAPPRSYSGAVEDRRELDFVGCANAFGETRAAGGHYRVDFLPYDTVAPERRYMVSARKGDVDAWYGATGERFGSCFDVLDYDSYSRASLIALGPSVAPRDVDVSPSGKDVFVDGAFAGFTGTAQGDRWIRLREKVPGVPILDAPVVAERQASPDGNGKLYDVPPGRYWVELGRRTGCSDWYPSRFPDNSAYFDGLDRGSEQWKAFSTLGSLSGTKTSGFEAIARNADPNPAGAAQETRPSGYAGWMYRSHCAAQGAGRITTVTISDASEPTKTVELTSPKGAVVRGHVSRTGGRTHKEMMVRLSSTDGTRVLRTALVGGDGSFAVTGLPAGTWTISLNADSWRGIGRTFTGLHSIRVAAGATHSAGSLRLRG